MVSIAIILKWKNIPNAGCTLSPRTFGESLGRELPETRLDECDSLQDQSENKVRVGEGSSHACWLKWVGLK